MAANRQQQQRKPRGAGKRFPPGQSGNPAGRKAGSRNKVTALAEKLLEDDSKEVVEAVVKAAKGGDMTAARLVLERIAPVRRGRSIVLSLPKIKDAADVGDAISVVIEAMGRGELSAEEAQAVASVVEIRRRAIETTDHEARLKALENETHGS